MKFLIAFALLLSFSAFSSEQFGIEDLKGTYTVLSYNGDPTTGLVEIISNSNQVGFEMRESNSSPNFNLTTPTAETTFSQEDIYLTQHYESEDLKITVLYSRGEGTIVINAYRCIGEDTCEIYDLEVSEALSSEVLF